MKVFAYIMADTNNLPSQYFENVASKNIEDHKKDKRMERNFIIDYILLFKLK
jgi:hypothetical protein